MCARIDCAVALLAALALFGCGAATPSMQSMQSTSPPSAADSLQRSLARESSDITTLRAYGAAQVVTPEATYACTVDISLHAPDSLRVKVTGPFGVLMGVMRATRDGYVVYNAWENTVTRGALEANAPLPFPGFPFHFDDAMEFLRGLPPMADSLSPAPGTMCVQGRDAFGRFFKCEQSDGGDRKAVIRGADGDEAYEYFRNFQPAGGVEFPRHIAASLGKSQSVTIDFDEVTLNAPPLDFSVPEPPSARQLGTK